MGNPVRCTMVPMERLDVETVLRWFDAVPTASRGLPPYLSGPLSAAELQVLDAGRRAVVAALADDEPDIPRAVPVSEDAANWLADYLTAFAAGLADARRSEGAEPGAASPLHVVAGLITGAAAVAGRPGGQPYARTVDRGEFGSAAEYPSASEAAHRLGAAAADEAVSGASLDRVTREAQAAAPTSWEPTQPADHARVADLLRRRLLMRLITALATVTGPTRPAVALPAAAPGWHRACVDVPGDHIGEPMLAEITFLTVDDAGAADLADVLREAGVAFGTYSEEGSLGFHIHAGDPGAVITEIFSLVVPFDLRISHLPER